MDPSLLLPLGDILDPYKLSGVSDAADRIDLIISVIQWFMLLLFVGWGSFMAYCLYTFRAREGQTAEYVPVKAKISKVLEVGVLVFEIIVLVALAQPLWSDVKNDFPDEDEAVKMRVVAQQFQWYFHNPGKDGKFGRISLDAMEVGNEIGVMALSSEYESGDPYGEDDFQSTNIKLPVSSEWEPAPEGTPDEKRIRKENKSLLYISSKDVIHSFGVQRLRVKQDAVPGQEIPLWVTSRITSDELRERLKRTYKVTERHLNSVGGNWSLQVMEANKEHTKGQILTWSDAKSRAEEIKRLQDAGVTEIIAAPKDPIEIACSQLCGAQHWKMRATIDYVSQEEYDAWVDRKGKDQ